MAAGETRIKVVLWDDDQGYALRLAAVLERAGVEVVSRSLPRDVETALAAEASAALLVGELDCRIGEGESLVALLRRVRPELPLLLLVSRPTLDGAVNAIREGAVDYLLKKNFTPKQLTERILEILSHRQMKTTKTGTGGKKRSDRFGLLFRDPRMARVIRLADKAAVSRATVLIQGESGTGKELLARYIHARSPRAEHPLVAINCAALPENLLESELFGYEKGAFTGATQRRIGKFEQADGSSLLLDELGELALPLQSKLLRVIQEGEVDRLGGSRPIPVDVRIIATTNRDLEDEVKAGRFRQDLFFRLNVIPLVLPPLRERPQDIELLLQEFIDRYSRLNQRRFTGLAPAARKWLLHYDYPGNVRELENLVERAVVLADGQQLELGDFILDPESLPADSETAVERANTNGISPDDSDSATPANGPELPLTTLAEMEHHLIRRTLQEVDANRTRAAARLGISIRTLRNKLKEYREKYGEEL